MSFKSILLLITIPLLLLSCKKKKSKDKIVIATAANMQFVMKEMVKDFEQQTNIQCDIIVGSSGKLTAQIKEGAPYDILVAANMKYPQEIYTSGLSHAKPKVYAYGKLALWSVNKHIKPSLNLLKDTTIKHIALANPETAPYGFAALEVLKNEHIYNDIQNKLVFGESISQTNQFITLQSAEIGFTAMSVVLSPQLKNTGNWVEIDLKNYSPIEQGIVVIKQKDKINPLALKFYDYLFSAKSKEILRQYGYDIAP